MPSPFAPSAAPIAPLLEPELQAEPAANSRANFRVKTAGTRLTVAEVEEVEAAAKRAGKTLAEWLREVALRAARPAQADPVELVLQELAAARYILLNLFQSTAQANAKGEVFPPEQVLKIRDAAEARKHAAAKKLLADFQAAECKSAGAPAGGPGAGR